MEFEKIVQEDFEYFREISKRFKKIDLVNIPELQQLTIDSWLLATRWSEIQAMSKKIAQEYGISKCDFSDWAYQKYRQLQELHITCRSWLRTSKEEERLNNLIVGD